MPIQCDASRAKRLYRLTIDKELALVRAIETIDDIHQRAFTCAILTQERQDPLCAASDSRVARHDAWKDLGDIARLEDNVRHLSPVS